jgi:glycosyltransferase involved in cell wall biosynthesis
MKILLFSSFSAAWNSVRPEAEIFIQIAAKGHTVYVATQKESPYTQRFISKKISVFDCYPKSKICPAAISRLRQIIKTHRVDIVYATNSKTIPNAAFACMGLPVRLVSYRGTSKGLYRHDPSAYLTHLHPRINGISCNAEAVRQDVRKRLWKKIPVRTIYKGHDISWYQEPPADLSRFGIPSHAVVLCCAANARPSKGIDVLLAACGRISDLEDLFVLVVGQDVDNPKYLALRDRLESPERVILAGFQSDVPRIIAAGQLYIQPSVSREGMAKTIIEAMAQGVAPIATNVGGAAELIIDGETGYIVPPNDPDVIASRIRKLYSKKDLRTDMGIRARKRIAGYFNVENAVEGHLALFEEILAGSKKHRIQDQDLNQNGV